MHDISTVNFDYLADSIQEELSFLKDPDYPDFTKDKFKIIDTAVIKFCDDNKLLSNSYWFLPQLLAEIGTWKASPDYSGLGTVKLNCITSRNKGIWYLCMHSRRSDFIKDQYKEPNTYYCRLVPLILAAFKKFQNIPYSKWTETEYIVEKDLNEAMTCDVPEFSTEELLRVREDALIIKSGKSAGKFRSAQSCFKLYGMKNEKMGEVPALAQIMLTQMWCAHPASRNKYMVLDPRDWDRMPNVLIDTNIF